MRKPLRAVVGHRRDGFHVNLQLGGETVDEAGPFDAHHEAVEAGRRMISGPRDLVVPLPTRSHSEPQSRNNRQSISVAWWGEWAA